jgi:hypothetical protein
MRGATRDALMRMGLVSQSWEYASEMVLKSVHLGLTTTEVPVSFFKDPEGRISHLVRGGWFSPWHAGWINLKAMFVFGADFFLLIPGILLLLIGLVPLCLLALGPLQVGRVTFSLNAMLYALFVALLGLQLFLTGTIAQSLYDGTGRKRQRWLRFFPYTRTTILAALFFVVGAVPVAHFAVAFIDENYRFSAGLITLNHHAVFGIFLMMASALVFVSMLVIQAIGYYIPLPVRHRRRPL